MDSVSCEVDSILLRMTGLSKAARELHCMYKSLTMAAGCTHYVEEHAVARVPIVFNGGLPAVRRTRCVIPGGSVGVERRVMPPLCELTYAEKRIICRRSQHMCVDIMVRQQNI